MRRSAGASRPADHFLLFPSVITATQAQRAGVCGRVFRGRLGSVVVPSSKMMPGLIRAAGLP